MIDIPMLHLSTTEALLAFPVTMIAWKAMRIYALNRVPGYCGRSSESYQRDWLAVLCVISAS